MIGAAIVILSLASIRVASDRSLPPIARYLAAGFRRSSFVVEPEPSRSPHALPSLDLAPQTSSPAARGPAAGVDAGRAGRVGPPTHAAQIPDAYRRDPLRFLFEAPADSLVTLPGIGPVLAERVISARSGKSSFTRWEQLLSVKGIGPKTLERLKSAAEPAPESDR